MAQTPIKVLVTGSVNGRFTELFDKAKTINNKYGPFDVLLCTGNFFNETSDIETNALLQGVIDVPLTTYFITGSNALPAAVQSRIEKADGEITSNLYHLGKRGVLTTAQGLKIAFLSGALQDSKDADEGEAANKYTQKDIQALQSTHMPITSPAGVDILLTHEWPGGIETHSALKPASSLATCTTSVAQLAAVLKPRYHFAASEGVFYEREPYANAVGFGGPEERPADHVSRFIGLGDALNTSKQRWFYAFNLAPLSTVSADTLKTVPENTTSSPFVELLSGNASSVGQKRSHTTTVDDASGGYFYGNDAKRPATVPPEGYVCNRCHVPGHWIKECPNASNDALVCRACNQSGHHIRDCPNASTHRREPPAGYLCKICKTPGHFINECPEKQQRDPNKRGADLESCWFCLANPKLAKHLIVSIGDSIYATLAKGPVVSSHAPGAIPGGGHVLLIPITHYPTFRKIPMEAQVEVVAELEKYKSALRQLFEKHGCDMVVFEVCRETLRGMSHAHLQVVPVPKEKSPLLEETCLKEAESQGIQFTDRVPENPEVAYFKIDLPNGRSLVHIIQPRERFNLQFGRLAIAKVLGQPEREDWKACAQSEEEERKDANDFKAVFKPFDFTL
ncbi:CwfJ C-terminus 1-domain-containing protein-like protein [Radiomyces spectabilis]|uniref:CwfJ C-terminus 1-domain-containing protein-like protein n=1 Tax=Radiomyces spectabilis TaxID=64574 RepID=UPI00221F8836|nr:CwfJ C-terminus 1-domain-containing protein-like protein [Radiomyces spectabilis]KAI8373000.1 CwfJ C-terminus 1-domain-containing protein-like protein [Radiomyces spectabilis]